MRAVIRKVSSVLRRFIATPQLVKNHKKSSNELGFDEVMMQAFQKHGSIEVAQRKGSFGKDFTKKEAANLAADVNMLIDQDFFGDSFKRK